MAIKEDDPRRFLHPEAIARICPGMPRPTSSPPGAVIVWPSFPLASLSQLSCQSHVDTAAQILGANVSPCEKECLDDV